MQTYRIVLEDGDINTQAWELGGGGSRTGRVADTIRGGRVLRYRGNGKVGKGKGDSVDVNILR